MKNKTAPIDAAPEMLAMHPHKFALWIGIVSIVMMFGAFTSAYIVRQGEGNWLVFNLPNTLWYTTAVLLASSASMHWAYLMAKTNNQYMLRIATTITLILGGIFLYGQVYAWGELVQAKVFFAGKEANPAGSFLYVLTGIHAVHLISGIIFLLVVFFSAFAGKIHAKNLTRIEMCATYWHFLDFLWLYLFVFLILNNN